jgi:hypothetical protein
MVAVLPLITMLPALTVTLPGALLKVTVMVASGWMVLPAVGLAETKLAGSGGSSPQPATEYTAIITKTDKRNTVFITNLLFGLNFSGFRIAEARYFLLKPVLHTSCIVSTVPLQPLESSARTSNGRFADPTMARENLIAQKICARFDRKNLALVWV